MSRRIKAVANLDLQALFAAPQASRNPISHRADHDREAIAFSRLCLAVRGWVEPMGLVRQLAGDRTEAVVATLASEALKSSKIPVFNVPKLSKLRHRLS